MLVPAHATCSGVLRYLGCEHISIGHVHDLQVERNGFPWDPIDPQIVAIDDGDHILVELAPHQDPQHQADIRIWLQSIGLQVWDSPDMEENANAPDAAASSFSLPSTQVTCGARRVTFAPHSFPDATFVTWYVSHARAPLCHTPRILTLSHDPNLWKPTIIQTWNDVVNPLVPFQVSWVMPRPPTMGWQADDQLPHLIIEQEPLHRQVSVLLTTSRMMPHSAQLTQVAISVPEIMDAQRYRQAAGVESDCVQGFQCEVACIHCRN